MVDHLSTDERERQVRSIVAAVVTLSEFSAALTTSAEHFRRAAQSFASDVATLKASIGLVDPHHDTGAPHYGG